MVDWPVRHINLHFVENELQRFEIELQHFSKDFFQSFPQNALKVRLPWLSLVGGLEEEIYSEYVLC